MLICAKCFTWDSFNRAEHRTVGVELIFEYITQMHAVAFPVLLLLLATCLFLCFPPLHPSAPVRSPANSCTITPGHWGRLLSAAKLGHVDGLAEVTVGTTSSRSTGEKQPTSALRPQFCQKVLPQSKARSYLFYLYL